MRRGALKPKSAFGKFAKAEEHAKWAIRRRKRLKIKALMEAQSERDEENWQEFRDLVNNGGKYWTDGGE